MNDSINRKRACLSAATEACCGDRALNYGKPEDNFARIATMWSAWFAIKKPPTVGELSQPFSTFDVAVMNILLKIARLANTPGHQDSWIDIAGYAACGADITGKLPPAPFDLGEQKRSDEGLGGDTGGTPNVASVESKLPNMRETWRCRRLAGVCYNCGGELISRTNSRDDGFWCTKCGWKQ